MRGGGSSGGMRSGGFGGGGAAYRGGGGGAYRGGSGGIVHGGGDNGYRGGSTYGFRGGYNNYMVTGASMVTGVTAAIAATSTMAAIRIGRYWGFGFGAWPAYYSGYYPYDYGYDYGYGYGSASPASYSQPNVTVVYPSSQSQASPNTVYVERASPVVREYDQYGQEVAPPSRGGTSSPIYLIAFKDQMIHAAISYSVDGATLRYVTLQHEAKQVSLDSIDRDLTIRLNRERRVAFQLP